MIGSHIVARCLVLAFCFAVTGCNDPAPAKKDTASSSNGKTAGSAKKAGKAKGKAKDKGAAHVIKLRFHLLKAPGSVWLDTTADEKQVKIWIEGANEVWKQANVRFELEKIVTEDAIEPKKHDEAQETFAKLKKKSKKKGEKTKKKDRKSWSKELKEAKTAQLKTRSKALPLDNRIGKGIDVYVVRKMVGAGGIFGCPLGAVLYSESRGKGFNIAKVLAHELGHALDLKHTKCADDKNLMMEGGCKHKAAENETLNDEQIARARKIAATGKARVCKKGEESVED